MHVVQTIRQSVPATQAGSVEVPPIEDFAFLVYRW